MYMYTYIYTYISLACGEVSAMVEVSDSQEGVPGSAQTGGAGTVSGKGMASQEELSENTEQCSLHSEDGKRDAGEEKVNLLCHNMYLYIHLVQVLYLCISEYIL